jgi:hypothetical protein
MAIYKDIYYANSSDNLSKYDIEYASAVSIGDKLEEIKLGSAVIVDDAAARDALFPTPQQGDGVWVNNLNIEQRYYELLSSSNPGGRNPAGWYRVTPSNNIIDVGTSPNGEVNFTNVSSVALGGIFQDSFVVNRPSYKSYKIVGNITSISPTTGSIRWAFAVGGSSPITETYYFAENAWTTVDASSNGSTSNFAELGPGTANQQSLDFELEIMNGFKQPPSYPDVVGFQSRSAAGIASGYPEIARVSGHVNSRDLADGLRIFSSGGQLFSGTIKVYGIR